MAEVIDKNRLPVYQNGAEGFVKFTEENVKFEVPDRGGRFKWMYPTELPTEPDPVTGKSFAELWENQKEVLREALVMRNGKFKYRVVVFCWPRGEGKCEAKGSKVLMYNGTIKKVEDVRVGDQLMGDDNTPRNVLSLANGEEEMYEVVPMRGESKVVTKDHVLSLKRRQRGKDDGRPDKKAGQVFDISVEDYLKQSNYFQNMTLLYKVPIDWPEQEVPIDPYFLGLWLGDGNSNTPAVTTMDQEVADYVYKIADIWRLHVREKEEKRKHNKAKTYFITTTHGAGYKGSNSLLSCFRENNLINNKHIPQVYKSNSREVRLQILAGIVDSDGYINRNSIQFSQKDKKLVDDIAFIARSLGLHAEYTEKVVNSKTYYTLGISGDCSIIPTKIPRKQCSPRSDWKDILVTGIKEIRSVGKREYYGFNLDGNGRYVTGDFTVTHNSLLVCLIQLWKFFCFPGQLIVFGALSKDQTRFVHYDITKSILMNSPKLLNVIGKKNVQQSMFFLKSKNNDIVSSIRPISSYTGIVSNITGYTFSEMFALKDFNFFYQLDGSTRNIINGLGTIDSTVSNKEHVLYRLYRGARDGSDPLTFFHHRSAPNAHPDEFWHPLMDESQINSYRSKFPPAEFDRYFRNVWGLDSGKLFPPPVVNSVFNYAYIDGNENRRLDDGEVLNISNKINDLLAKTESEDKRKNPNVKTVKKRRRRTRKKAASVTEKIQFLESHLVPTDEIYSLQRSGLPKMASNDDLRRLSDIYDTGWTIHAGIDRSDPMARDSEARTIVTITAKGLTGSRSSRNMVGKEEVPNYIYFLLHLEHVPDASLEGIKNVLRNAYWEYDGIDSLCAERWGIWDLAPWCEEYDIQFEAIFPSFDLQRKAFSEFFMITTTGRFKSPEVSVPGSTIGNILHEEMESFDHDPDKKWYGSPQKNERNGVQDDSIFSLAWGIYGGRNFGVDDFRDRKGGSHFGMFVPDSRNLAEYNL